MKTNTKTINQFRKNVLATAISICLPLSSQAANFDVTISDDDGTGLVANTLSWAILQANTTAGDDTISITTDVNLTGVMKSLIDSNVSIQDTTGSNYISAANTYRPFFIKSGRVILNNLRMLNTRAKGGSSDEGAPGAGMGGAIFIYDGDVSINNVRIDNAMASGGDDLNDGSSTRGGGGMFGNAGNFGGGGLFASGAGNNGGYGGTGNYNNTVANFGKGGSFDGTLVGEAGGFGGGGGFPSGHGGFGAGGAVSTNGSGNAGNGGFGGGAPYAGYGGNYSGTPGFGGSVNAAAGMGGAIFIRSGTLDIRNSSIQNSSATATNGALGLGGGIFILHTDTNSNGNNQGMPWVLATVTGCQNTFGNNIALDSTGAVNNNNDIFDMGNRINQGYPLTAPCRIVQNLTVSNGNEDGTGLIPNTLSWAILQANTTLGDDIITLKTNIVFTGVMKRLIDSNMTIQSDGIRRTIDGNSQFRPLFIKSGQVLIKNLDIKNTRALGGTTQGGGGGAGMGGSIFIYDGQVNISNINITNSIADSSPNFYIGNGGGGMFGRSYNSTAGGGLFADASSTMGGYGGYGNYQNIANNFGVGGDFPGGDGGFGAGGARSGGSLIGGDGGFGGGGGYGESVGGDGGFGAAGGFHGMYGNSTNKSGYGAFLTAAAMGGAIFIRTGTVEIKNTSIHDSLAITGTGVNSASALGGGIFVLHSTTNIGLSLSGSYGNASQQGMPTNLATINTCNLNFNNNSAAAPDANGNNTDNIFDLGGRITDCNIFSDGFE